MDSSEIEGELEMLSAMYSDSMTITSTDLDNLHRIESGEIISPNGKSKSSSSSPTTTTTENERTIINLRLRKNVEIELAFPSQGYYSNSKDSTATKKVRLDVLNSPANMDSEKLLMAMKRAVKEHNVGDGALLITICQAAEQYVDGALEQSPSTVNNNNRYEQDDDDEDKASQQVLDYNGEGDEDEEQGTMMTMVKSNSSKMMMTMMSSNSSDFYPLSETSDAAILAELAKRKCVRGSNPISDKGSKFLAHCAPISSEREAREIIALIREIKSISQACHPCIWAYRFTNPQTKVVHYDCDDDGEKNGAKSILFVMEQMKVDGYICTCTRFFGGTLLGPIRFRYISQVTRSVIEEAKAAGSSK
jgi:hypothetical protein